MLRLSVVIPVKNGSATLARCLRSITEQTVAEDLEIIVLDSNSADDSVNIARKFNARIIDVPEGRFDHGLTRNLGVQQAQGEFVYLTVQDATIGKRDMLERMVLHFRDEKVMAVSGHQAVPLDKETNPLVWYRPYSTPLLVEKTVKDPDAFKSMTQEDKQALISWDNVVAMYRKTALTAQPFVQTEFTEDWFWSYEALLKGWKLLHDPSLVVYHYHHHSFKYAFNITYTANYHFYKFFKFIPRLPAVGMPIFRSAYHVMKNKQLSLKEKLYWTRHNWAGIFGSYFSTLDFLRRLKIGHQKSIEEGYQRYCSSIPQGKRRKMPQFPQ